MRVLRVGLESVASVVRNTKFWKEDNEQYLTHRICEGQSDRFTREPTFEIIEEPIPSRKRQSLDAPEGAQPSALKRLKETEYVNKENVFTASSSS
jgi:hypothetical protein